MEMFGIILKFQKRTFAVHIRRALIQRARVNLEALGLAPRAKGKFSFQHSGATAGHLIY